MNAKSPSLVRRHSRIDVFGRWFGVRAGALCLAAAFGSAAPAPQTQAWPVWQQIDSASFEENRAFFRSRVPGTPDFCLDLTRAQKTSGCRADAVHRYEAVDGSSAVVPIPGGKALDFRSLVPRGSFVDVHLRADVREHPISAAEVSTDLRAVRLRWADGGSMVLDRSTFGALAFGYRVNTHRYSVAANEEHRKTQVFRPLPVFGFGSS